MNIDYIKRKNNELFDCLEKNNFVSKIQNYIPIYNTLFTLNSTNYNNINLNHSLYLSSIKNLNTLDNCLISSILSSYSTISNNQNVFFKKAPLLDPYKYLIGKYENNQKILYDLPTILSTNENCIEEYLDSNNSAYIDGFFSFLTNQLHDNNNFIHGNIFYGSYLSIVHDFKIDVADDLDFLINSSYFNKHKNKLFLIDNYDHLYQEEDNEKPPLTPIIIDNTDIILNKFDIIEQPNDINNIEQIEQNNIDSTTNVNALIEINNLNEFMNKHNFENIDENIDETSDNCSSRTSYTTIDDIDIIDNDDCDDYDNNDDSEIDCDDSEIDCDDSDIDCDDSDIDCDDEINVTISKFPVQIIALERYTQTFNDLILNSQLEFEEWHSALMQIIMILITYQKVFNFTHNDLHTNNIMFKETNEKFIYYQYNNILYKVPTFGRIFKIIDFGRSIYTLNNKIYCSNSFKQGNDASTQYNTEPYYNKNKPRIDPNPSFDLCRLGCSIFDFIIDDISDIHNIELNCIQKLINEWCCDDKGLNILYKKDGSDRYLDFKLYKMIARCVTKHTPQNQLIRSEFKQYIIKSSIKVIKHIKKEFYINIDIIPCMA